MSLICASGNRHGTGGDSSGVTAMFSFILEPPVVRGGARPAWPLGGSLWDPAVRRRERTVDVDQGGAARLCRRRTPPGKGRAALS